MDEGELLDDPVEATLGSRPQGMDKMVVNDSAPDRNCQLRTHSYTEVASMA